MENLQYGDIIDGLRKLVAENKSLQDRLDECRDIIKSRDSEINMLQQIANDAHAAKSTMDSKVEQMDELKKYFSEIRHIVDGVPATGQQTDAAFELAELETLLEKKEKRIEELEDILRQDYASETSNDNSTNSGEMKSLIEQKETRIKELENLLAAAIEERDEWRQLAMHRK
jgi:thioredoxin-like negative regulator of GroEL